MFEEIIQDRKCSSAVTSKAFCINYLHVVLTNISALQNEEFSQAFLRDFLVSFISMETKPTQLQSSEAEMFCKIYRITT